MIDTIDYPPQTTGDEPAWTAALKQLAPIFQAHCDEHHLPGCAYGVVTGGRLVASASIGVVNPGAAEAAGAPTANTVYRIASMTKSFGALAILMLRDAGKLALDTAVAEYIPELRQLAYPTRDCAPITVRQLLTMASGWPEDNPWGDRQLWRNDAELGEILAPGVSFANAPGVTYEYSNLGYMVLGRVIANVSGESSLDFITHRILQPLGMRDTVWNAEEVDPQRRAKGYHWLEEKWIEEQLLPSGGDAAVFGGLYSTVADLARWVTFQLSAWPPRDDPEEGIVRRATLREMQQPQRTYMPDAEAPEIGKPVVWPAGGYGCGLTITYEGDLTIVGHAGGLPGFGSHMCWAPDYDLGVVALGNVRYASMRLASTEALRQLVRQGAAHPRQKEPAPALDAARRQVNRLLARWDDGSADRLFADNFFLDDSREWWRGEMGRLAAVHGRLRDEGIFEAENALRGTWKLLGERGWVNAFVTLTPTVPPRVQELTLESMLPPGPLLQTALGSLVKLINRPSQRSTNRLFIEETVPTDRHTFCDKIRIVAALCGECRLGQILAGNGEDWVRLLIEGAKGGVEADLVWDGGRRRFAEATFRQVR
jgi:CubicO group peptidase (beta-lactamase class C family)